MGRCELGDAERGAEMNHDAKAYCAICLETRLDEDGWFLLRENQWTDRLQIVRWDDALAAKPEVQAACGAAHVQQMVVHWMTTGSLNYPFARSDSHPPRNQKRCPEPSMQTDADTRGIKVLGELAVHRESLERALRENPESLSSILQALLSALTHGSHTENWAEPKVEERSGYILTEV
jgi:hypothetical protein